MDTSSRGGLRHVRRMSNWTAATLIVGTGAAAAALAHQASHAPPAPASAGGTAASAGTAAAAGTAAVPAGASTPGGAGPQVTHSVAATTASGVTVTTTTRTVNGKTVVTRVRHAPAAVDNWVDN